MIVMVINPVICVIFGVSDVNYHLVIYPHPSVIGRALRGRSREK